MSFLLSWMFYWELSKTIVCFTDNAICINEVLYSWRKESGKLVDGNRAWKPCSNPLSQIVASPFLWLNCTSGICFGNMYVRIERLFSMCMVIFYVLHRKQSKERVSVVIYKIIRGNMDAFQFVNHTVILRKNVARKNSKA